MYNIIIIIVVHETKNATDYKVYISSYRTY